MYCLGIESTAHTFGVSIVQEVDGTRKILSNIRDLYSTEEGGLIPAEISEHHVACAHFVLTQALTLAGITISEIELIAYSRSPGIGHALRIGAGFARALALRYTIPLIGVNHCIAHLEVGRYLGGEQDPVLLYASGANTQVIAFEGGSYRIFGETLDLGVGNFLDTVARKMGLGFPGGPELEKLASSYDGPLLNLPYSVKGMDISLSGAQTSVGTLLLTHSQEAVAFSVQETVFAMLVEVAERALAHTGKQSLVIGGGVGCNARLQDMCRLMCEERGVRFFAPAKEYLVDNGAMIALLGLKIYDSDADLSIATSGIDPYERTDEVDY